jgi:hypothetical protein
LWRSRWNVDWQGKPKFSEKTCPSATSAVQEFINVLHIIVGTKLQARKSQVRFPMRSLDFFFLRNSSIRTMALGPTQPLTEMSIRNISGGK